MPARIRASPYETGLYFVDPEPGTTMQSIGSMEWKVGSRYTLHKVLGYGSFSCVCLATDHTTGEMVALKRIGDVLQSVDYAKRVLREISILRRATHPNLIALRDAFVRPSATGQCRLIGGKLVSASIDLYLSMEYADGGDLFHMRGQLAPEEATSVLWQLLQALKYLHGIGVWHRDIKSSNIFVTYESGVRVIKLGDFGSARSAAEDSFDDDGGGGGVLLNTTLTPGITIKKALHPADSYQEMEMAMKPSDLYAQPGSDDPDVDDEEGDADDGGDGTGSDGGNDAKMLETDNDDGKITNKELHHHNKQPRYQGNTSAMDLERPPSRPDTSLSTDPGHQPLPMTAPASLPPHRHHTTPNQDSQHPYHQPPASQKATGFKAPLTRVVMTPMYRAPEVVMSRGNYTATIDTWGAGCVFAELLQRVAYVGSAVTPHLQVAPLFALRGMPRAPEDDESFGRPDSAGTRREIAALFDVIGTPSWWDMQQIETEEWRKYLNKLKARAPTLVRRFKAAGEVAIHLLGRLLDFSPERRAGCQEALEHEFFEGLRQKIKEANVQAAASLEVEAVEAVEAAVAIVTVDAALPTKKDADEDQEAMLLTTAMQSKQASVPMSITPGGVAIAVDAAAAAATHSLVAAATPPVAAPPPTAASTGQRQYWDEENPGKALALLEEELETAAEEAELSPGVEGSQRLRALLEAECTAVSAAAALAIAAQNGAAAADAINQGRNGGATSGVVNVSNGNAGAAKQKKAVAGVSVSGLGGSTSLSGILRRRGPGLQEDTAGTLGSTGQRDIGAERLSNVADTWQGRELDPRKFLGPKRHGEWTEQGGGGGPAAGPRWGVTSIPPGMGADDPRLHAIVKKQQER